MGIATETMLKNKIKNGVTGGTYFVFGNDGYLKKHYVDMLIDKTVSRDDDFNFIKFLPSDDLQAVYDAVIQYPFMAEKKCVVLTDYDFEHAQAKEFEKLLSLCCEKMPTTVFIYFCDDIEVSDKKNQKLQKIVDSVELSGGMAVKLDHRSEAELVMVLTAGLKKRGGTFESGAARYLIECCGQDMSTLQAELEKLSLFCGDKPVDNAMIDRVCVKSVEASVYDLYKKILSFDIKGALSLLDGLFYRKTEPIVILSAISSVFSEVFRAKAAVRAGVDMRVAAGELGYKGREFVLTRARGYSDKITDRVLDFCFDELLKADKELKGFCADPRITLEELTVRLIYILSRGEQID